MLLTSSSSAFMLAWLVFEEEAIFSSLSKILGSSIKSSQEVEAFSLVMSLANSCPLEPIASYAKSSS
jgi:hypothetical protein